MKDSLKDFIDHHREEFDDRLPRETAWEKIRATLNGQGRTRFLQSLTVWRAAAAVFFALSIFLLVRNDQSAIGKKEVSRLQVEFSDLESFYKEQIAEKVSFIEDFDNPYESDRVTQDLQKLEAMYQVLREEMKSKPSEKVKDALVLNMLIRIDLLNQQIKQLEDSQKKKYTDPTI